MEAVAAVALVGPSPRWPARREEHQLNREQKAEAIAELAERLRGSDTIMAADFRGLSVKEVGDLRRRLREVESEFQVVKNTLARRAAAEAGREGLVPLLEGPSAFVWVAGDPAATAKALTGFAREHEGRMAVKGGLLEGASIDLAEITRLATLPAREQLLAQLAGGVAAPLSGLAGAMNALIGGLARALGALQAQRSDESPSAA